MADLGFIGLGKMGAAIAERLEGDGVTLHIFDPSAEALAPFVARGAVAHASALAVAEAATTVFACLPSPEVSIAAAGEIVGAPLTHYVEMSTIGRTAMDAVVAALPGVAVIDAPVSGGPDGARAGTLAVMAAGAPDAIAAVRPWLARIAGRLVVVGDRPGLGQTMKLVNNLTGAALIAVTLEAVIAGAKAGLDPAAMVEVLNAGSGRSSVTAMLLPEQVLTGRFAFGAAMATMVKDVELGLGEAAALGAPMAVIEAAAARWRAAMAEAGGDADLTAIFRVAEDAAGVRLRAA